MSILDQEVKADIPLVKNRTMEIVVSLLFIGLASVFMIDCWSIGVGWIEGSGPASGSFPFFMSLFMALASFMTLVQAMAGTDPDGEESFVGRTSMTRVLYLLAPTIAYVVAIEYLGIYVSSAIFITLFMIASRSHILKVLFVGVGTATALFLMFEVWFLVPLPKGPFEALIGY